MDSASIQSASDPLADDDCGRAEVVQSVLENRGQCVRSGPGLGFVGRYPFRVDFTFYYEEYLRFRLAFQFGSQEFYHAGKDFVADVRNGHQGHVL